MPNWCNNTLELAHEDPAMLERARVAFNEGRLCEEFVPVPKSLHIVAGCVSDEAEQKKLEEDTAQNLVDHGYGNWYDYCVNEWGTKWDVGGDGMTAEMENGQLVMSFDSAWSPPVAFYEKMLDLGFEVRAYYYEGGMNFAGIWDNGDDDFYDLASSSAEVREQIPAVLDEMFCISEGMEMWEDEENIDIDLDGGLSSTNE
jgi:hypothetical protein